MDYTSVKKNCRALSAGRPVPKPFTWFQQLPMGHPTCILHSWMKTIKATNKSLNFV